MTILRTNLRSLALVGGLVPALYLAAAGVDVTVEFDKTFDFKVVHTWAWNPSGPGDVKMARTADDDADAMRRRAEPIVVDAVNTEIVRRGLTTAAAAPDVTVTYYLLLTTNMSAQTMGQFLPATTGWGLPPFAPATQSITMMNRGSLVLDLSARGNVVWRGVAQANIKFDTDERTREALLRDAVRTLLAKYPPRR